MGKQKFSQRSAILFVGSSGVPASLAATHTAASFWLSPVNIFLTTGDDTPNGAGVRFLVDGADPAAYEGFTRMVFLFDGNDGESVARARAQWKAAKAAGCGVTYWQQNDNGSWVKKA